MDNTNNILFARPYEAVREDCHKIKEGDIVTLEKWADEIAPALPDKAILVPVPGHNGVATYTKTLGQKIIEASSWAFLPKDVRMIDCLLSPVRPSLCQMKKENLPFEDVDLGIRYNNRLVKPHLEAYISKGYEIILLDNVIDTGKTARACLKALRIDAKLVCVGDTGAWKSEK